MEARLTWINDTFLWSHHSEQQLHCHQQRFSHHDSVCSLAVNENQICHLWNCASLLCHSLHFFIVFKILHHRNLKHCYLLNFSTGGKVFSFHNVIGGACNFSFQFSFERLKKLGAESCDMRFEAADISFSMIQVESAESCFVSFHNSKIF